MAIFLAACGWEQGLNEATYIAGGYTRNPTISTTKPRTGARSLLFNASSDTQPPTGVSIPPTTELRVSFSINHMGNLGLSSNNVSYHVYVFYLYKQDGSTFRFAWHRVLSNLYIFQGSSTILAEASANLTDFTVQNVHHEISVAAKIHATDGWLKLYVNGVEAVSFEGNTGTSPIIGVGVGGNPTANVVWSTGYFDDLCVEDTTGEPAQAATHKRLYYAAVSGNGSVNQFVGSDGNSTDNYLLVDEIDSNDGDTTFVLANSNGLIDEYVHAAITMPSNYIPLALLPKVQAKRGNAAIQSTLQLRLSKGGQNIVSDEILPSTAYTPLSAAFTELPDGSPLTIDNINNTNIGIVSSGVYE